jgi:hypothetical protein
MKDVILDANRKNRRKFGRTKNNGITPKSTLQPMTKERGIMKGLIGLQKNNQGGWNIMTSMSDDKLEVFRKKGQGLYAWMTLSQYKLMLLEPKKRYPIKFGQFGSNAKFGTTPQETIDNYTWINEPVVILWVLYFSSEELKVGSPFEIEQKVKTQIGEQVLDGKGTETFMTSINIIVQKVSLVLYNSCDRVRTFPRRKRQQEFVDKFVSHRLSGGKEFLLGAIMRYGKNFAWLEANYDLYKMGFLKKGDVLLVLTAKPNTFDTLEEDINGHIHFKDFNYILMKDFEDGEYPIIDTNKINIIAVSTQLVYNTKRKKTRNFLKSLHFRDVFVDECHSGTDTKNFNDFVDELSIEHKTFVSGTPHKTIVSRGFTPLNSYFYGYTEQQIDKRIDIENGIENDSVTLKTFIPKVSYKYRNNPNYSEKEQFTIKKLLSTNDDGTFVYGGDAYDFISDILGKSNNKSKYSPFRFIKNLNHTIWLLPDSIAVAKAFGKAIGEIAPEYKVIVASGNETKDISDVHDAILSNEKTITLTIGRFIEGTTVKFWNGCLILSETESLEKYFQFIFRVTTPMTGKEFGYVFDFSPERAFQMVFEIANAQASNENRDDSQQVLKEWLDCDNVYRMGDGPQPKMVDVSDILEQINKGDYRAATLTKTYNDWIDINQVDKDIISKFSDLKTYQKQVVKFEMNSNDMGGGKNYTQSVVKKEMTKKEKDELMKVIKNIVGIVAPLPLLASLYEQKTLQDILNNVPSESLEEVCKVNKHTFELLINRGILNPRQINYFL